jgi:hypothetical protein
MKKGIRASGYSLFFYRMSLSGRGFVPAKTLGEIDYEPPSFHFVVSPEGTANKSAR